MNYPFKIVAEDAQSRARRGILKTLHDDIETPVFMPVGTLGTIKGLLPEQVEAMGYKIILGNTYHLYLRPGEEIMTKAKSLRRFMAWPHSILTDSGGFQVFSLKGLVKLSEEGVGFQSHLDGKHIFLTPEEVIRYQEIIGSDIMMPLDECPDVHLSEKKMKTSVERTMRWELRALESRKNNDLLLFGIVQGGLNRNVRKWHASELAKHAFDGFSIGGLSVGEKNSEMYEMLEWTDQVIPRLAPRYLMGVGTPIDLLEGITRGVDMFDCVLPTRTARNGLLFTSNGPVSIKQSHYKNDFSSLDPTCTCVACTQFTKAYLRHLYISKEILSSVLNTIHNLTFYANLMKATRNAISEGIFTKFKQDFLKQYQRNG